MPPFLIYAHSNHHCCSRLHQRFSTYDTRVICDTLTKKLWHFAFIFMWHSWSNNIKKMTPRQKKVERTVVHNWLVTTHYSFVQVPSNLDENLSWKYHKIYKYSSSNLIKVYSEWIDRFWLLSAWYEYMASHITCTYKYKWYCLTQGNKFVHSIVLI